MNKHAIELRDVSVTRSGVPILRGINLAIATGTCCAILGPNGSGKSALMAVLSGYLWPTSGTVSLSGRTYGLVNLSEMRRTIGLIEPSRAPKFGEQMSVGDVVATGLFGTIMLPLHEEVHPGGLKRVEAELNAVGMFDLADRAYGKLSSGEKMKTLLARAMVSDSRILLLDEPTVGLDIGSRAACVAVLDRLLAREHPPTVVIVSHHLDELPEAVDSVVLVKAGRIVGQGPPAELLTSTHLSTLFDCRVDVLKNDGRYVAACR